MNEFTDKSSSAINETVLLNSVMNEIVNTYDLGLNSIDQMSDVIGAVLVPESVELVDQLPSTEIDAGTRLQYTEDCNVYHELQTNNEVFRDNLLETLFSANNSQFITNNNNAKTDSSFIQNEDSLTTVFSTRFMINNEVSLPTSSWNSMSKVDPHSKIFSADSEFVKTIKNKQENATLFTSIDNTTSTNQ